MKTLSIFLIGLTMITFSCQQDSKVSNTTINIVDSTNHSLTEETPTSNQTVATIPDELVEFIPENYSILDTLSGDLNLDKVNDYILILKRNGEDTLSDVVKHPEPRPLLILLRDKNDKLQFAKSNDNTVYCYNCGGAMGDPYTGLTIKDGYFSVEHYGGSAWRWSRIITYKYSTKDNDWYLHKDGYESFNANDPDKVERTIKTRKDFGVIKFENFDIYKEE